MRRILLTVVMALGVTFGSVSAQEFSGLDKSPADIATYPQSSRQPDKNIKVIYSRPQLKGRALSDLAPSGKVWRTGANEATEVVLYQDATINGKALSAGTYSLFTIPGKNQWTVIFNNKINQWGAYSYDESADALRAEADVSTASESLEAFSITFQEDGDNVHMVMGWGNTRVKLPMKF